MNPELPRLVGVQICDIGAFILSGPLFFDYHRNAGILTTLHTLGGLRERTLITILATLGSVGYGHHWALVGIEYPSDYSLSRIRRKLHEKARSTKD
jgi:hypothetical protein